MPKERFYSNVNPDKATIALYPVYINFLLKQYSKTSFNAFIALKEVFVNCNFKNSGRLYWVCFEKT